MRKLKKLFSVLAAILFLSSFYEGCTSAKNTVTESLETIRSIGESVISVDFSPSRLESPITINESVSSENDEIRPIEALKSICLDLDYSGSASVEIQDEPAFLPDEICVEEYQCYSDFDSLGRTGGAIACISGVSMMAYSDDREDISDIYPAGWHNARYDNIDEYGWLYNRCHVLMARLTDNFEANNLFTGTRYLNMAGMLPYELIVCDYLDANPDNHVIYRVTPVYRGNNLICSGVIMEAYSVEDYGEGLSFCVYCFNVQPGIEIDYETGYSNAEIS